LGQALIARGGVDLVPAGFGVTVGDDVFPGARPAVNLGRHEIATVLGAVTPWTSIDETVLRAERVDVFHATDHLIPKLSSTPVIA
ncbi:glycosyltransferase family 1 protein, partial [Paraburkholderia sp. SIMBA_049]